MAGIGTGAEGGMPRASGRRRDGSPCRRRAALAARLALPAKEEPSHG